MVKICSDNIRLNREQIFILLHLNAIFFGDIDFLPLSGGRNTLSILSYLRGGKNMVKSNALYLFKAMRLIFSRQWGIVIDARFSMMLDIFIHLSPVEIVTKTLPRVEY